jgi:hypothetical protein
MSKRRTAEQIQGVLREADRDLAKGLTVGDVCRKLRISQNAYHRWQQRFDPEQAEVLIDSSLKQAFAKQGDKASIGLSSKACGFGSWWHSSSASGS